MMLGNVPFCIFGHSNVTSNKDSSFFTSSFPGCSRRGLNNHFTSSKETPIPGISKLLRGTLDTFFYFEWNVTAARLVLKSFSILPAHNITKKGILNHREIYFKVSRNCFSQYFIYGMDCLLIHYPAHYSVQPASADRWTLWTEGKATCVGSKQTFLYWTQVVHTAKVSSDLLRLLFQQYWKEATFLSGRRLLQRHYDFSATNLLYSLADVKAFWKLLYYRQTHRSRTVGIEVIGGLLYYDYSTFI